MSTSQRIIKMVDMLGKVISQDQEVNLMVFLKLLLLIVRVISRLSIGIH